MMAGAEGEITADKAKIQIWESSVGSKGAWWYLEAVDGGLQSTVHPWARLLRHDWRRFELVATTRTGRLQSKGEVRVAA